MRVGAHLDNVDHPPESSYRRLRLMRAEIALTLWTAGTRHKRPVYDALVSCGVQQVCIRVGDERVAGSVDDYLIDVDQALNEAVSAGFREEDIDVQILNEPNLRPASPGSVGVFVGSVCRRWRRKARIVLPPVSRGEAGWLDYARQMVGAIGVLPKGTAYGYHVYRDQLGDLLPVHPDGPPCVITEFGHPDLSGAERGRWVVGQLGDLSRKGYGYACQFIVGGEPHGAWPRNYVMTDEEAAVIGARGVLPQPDEEATPMLTGVDVSNWQKQIEWPAVAASGRSFAFIKASEDDGFRDPWFSQNWQGCKGAGMVRGAYCFARPSKSSPAQSVSLFQAVIEAAGGLQPGDLIALDIEDTDYAGSLHVWAAEWLDLAERVFGVRPVIYTGHWYSGPHDLEHTDLGKYPLWYASYQDTLPSPPEGWDRITFWQNSAHAQVPGIVGDCDVDVFLGSLADLKRLGKPGSSAPPAPPIPVPAKPDARAALAKVKAAVAELEAALA